MKTKLIIAFALLVTLTTVAQQGINYKALIKDNGGNVVANQNITVQFSILQGAVNVYQETHNPTTDANGIVIVNIGEGTTADDFSSINWESDDHFLNVQIDTGSGLTDMGTTQFMAVPYAISAANVSGLEAIDEGNGVGWRFIGRNAANFGNIGLNAVDLSISSNSSTSFGATGDYSLAMGALATASGNNSTAIGLGATASGLSSIVIGNNSQATGDNAIAFGYSAQASGDEAIALGNSYAIGDESLSFGFLSAANGRLSTAIGSGLIVDSFNSMSIGQLNVGGGDPESWIPTDPLFEIGNSTNTSNRSNALTVLKNGTITAPSFEISEITDPKALITKEYLEANSSLASGLEAIDEGNGIGWRLIGRPNANYGNIGHNAVDFSVGTSLSPGGATGDSSFSMGTLNYSTGHHSFSFGSNSSATSDYSLAFGHYANAVGTYSISIGYNNIASRSYSIAMGYQSEANQIYAVAMGESTTSSGISSVAMGAETTASGNSSFAMGDSNIASGNTSVALGIITEVSGDYSLAMGNNVQVSSFAASALGYNLINDDPYATVVGQYNDNTTTASSLFMVGNGVSTANRANAFTVFQNGNATLAGTLTQSSDRRLKQDINELDYGLSEVMKLKPVSYLWNKHPDQPKSLGLIAQEVQPIINEIVHKAEDKNNILSVSYTELIPVLIKAIQEQQAIIESQKQTIQNQVQVSSEQTVLLQTLLDRVDAIEKQAIPSDVELVKN